MPVIGALGDLLTPDLYFFLHLIQIALFLIIIRNLDVYEREPYPVILVMFSWGALIAGMFAPPFNGFVASQLSPAVDAVFGAAITAPIGEELVKGAGLLVAIGVSTLLARRFGTKVFGGLTDGIVYGAAVGFGFAFTENLFYFVNFAAQQGTSAGLEVFLLRTDFLGFGSLLHAIFTGAFGAGLGAAVYARSTWRKVAYPVAGLAFGMAMHALWNGSASLALVQRFGFDFVADVFLTNQIPAGVLPEFERVAVTGGETIRNIALYGSLLLASVAIWRWLDWERGIIRHQLWDDVADGLLTEEEYHLLPQARRRFAWYIAMVRAGKLTQMRATRALHDACVEYALHKYRVAATGSKPEALHRARAEVWALRAYVVSLAALDSPAQPAPAMTPAAPSEAPTGPSGTEDVADVVPGEQSPNRHPAGSSTPTAG